MSIMDIHSHTWYSRCGRDDPRAVVAEAAKCGVEVFGISDHHYGVGDRYREYLSDIETLQKEYASGMRLLKGVEISSLKRFDMPCDEFVSGVDYCLVEHLDRYDETRAFPDLFAFLDRLSALTKVGIAHTDLFAIAPVYGYTPAELMGELARRGIFWELNVNYDSIHEWHEHAYVKEFFESPQKQKTVRDAGLCLSAGFDSHRIEDYRVDRLRYAARFLAEHALKQVTL